MKNEEQTNMYMIAELMDLAYTLEDDKGLTQAQRMKAWDEDELENRVHEFFWKIVKEGVHDRTVSPKWSSLAVLCNVLIEYARCNTPQAFLETLGRLIISDDSVVNRFYKSQGQPTLDDVIAKSKKDEQETDDDDDPKDSLLAIMYVSDKKALTSAKLRNELVKLKEVGMTVLLFTNGYSLKSGPLVDAGLIDPRCCFQVKDEDEFDRLKSNIHPFLLANLGILPPDLAMSIVDRPEKAS